MWIRDGKIRIRDGKNSDPASGIGNTQKRPCSRYTFTESLSGSSSSNIICDKEGFRSGVKEKKSGA